MIGKKGEDKLGELTPFLRNVIIVASLFVAVMIVLIIVYNVVSIDTETKKAEDALDLNIVKNSVKLDNGILKLSVGGKLEDLELAKVKFIISDGTNEKDISLDAEGFETQKSFEINLKELGIDYTKKITISIKPIIKKLTGEKELKVTDKISLSPSGETIQEEIPVTEEKISTTITGCDKCGGIFGKGCDKILCHSISEGCYYKGGFTRECASCSEMECGKYKTQTDCTTDRCKLSLCVWEKDECIKNPECGNGNVNSAANEECDDGNLINTDACTSYCKNAVCGDGYIKTGVEECDKGGANGIACTPSYGKTCTYCDAGCKLITLGGENCGDNNCQSAQGETCSTCPGDCGICIKANGETCSVGTECLSGYCYVDEDLDKYAPLSGGTKKCKQYQQLSGTDCSDNNTTIYQLLSCYTDADKDNYGTGSASSTCTGSSCSVAGKSSQGGDCLDTDNLVNPGATYHTTQHSTRGWDWDCSGDTEKDSSCISCASCSVGGSVCVIPGGTAACSEDWSSNEYDYLSVTCDTQNSCGATGRYRCKTSCIDYPGCHGSNDYYIISTFSGNICGNGNPSVGYFAGCSSSYTGLEYENVICSCK